MPLIIKPADLAPGMVLGEPLKRGSTVLLPKGKTLTESDVNAICRKWPQALIYISDAQIDDLVGVADEQIDYEANEALLEVARQASLLVTQFWKGEITKIEVLPKVRSLVEQALRQLDAKPILRAVPHVSFVRDDYLKDHVCYTFYYAIILAHMAKPWLTQQRKKNSSASGLSDFVAGDLTPLGLASLFADAGMSELGLLERTRELSEAQQQLMYGHVKQSVELLPPGCPSVVKAVVLSHHENMDGSGYPDRRSHQRVHVLSRILRIADSFDAAATTRHWRRAKSVVEVLWEMRVGPRARIYDQQLMKYFVDLVPPFPIGSVIQMTDGYYAVVVGRTRDPFKPLVSLIMDPEKKRIRSQDIDASIDLSLPKSPRMASMLRESLDFLYKKSDRN